MRMRAWILAGLLAASGNSVAADWFRDRFIDPDDGQFDMSNYLLDHRGALPVPIIITEPAIGYGGGIALSWFSESMRDVAARAQQSGARITPPNIYMLAAFGTENGTKGGALGARMSFLDDTWRYRGGAMAMSVNLDFYGIGGTLQVPVDKIGYNLKGSMVFNELTRRLGESDQWLGLRWLYTNLDTKLDFGTNEDAGLTGQEVAKKGSGLGLTYVFDSRDNIFFTRKGLEASVDAMFYSPSIGSDTTFQAYRAHAFAYIPAGDKAVVAVRADGRTARGDVPFYQLPFIDMRGVAAARYQDENVGVLELEGRYYVTPRWIVLAFLGAGRDWGRGTSFSDRGSIVSKGVGFRYVIAQRLGLSAGIDVAKGPDESAFYIQMGNAWR
jgi:outer membrane protein assembly factor BamA